MEPDILSDLFRQIIIHDLAIGPAIALVLAVLLLLASAFISACETAYFALNSEEQSDLKEENDRRSQLALRLLENPDRLTATFLIADNVVNVFFITLSVYAINSWISFAAVPWLGFVLQCVGLTSLILLFGEIMPKVYGQKDSLKLVRQAAPAVRAIVGFCSPLSALFVRSTSLFQKTFGKKRYNLSVDKLSKALELTSKAIPEEKEMLAEIIKFYNKTANEVMTPRLDVEDLNIKATFPEVLHAVNESGFSRIPVYAENEDNIKGILYTKDLLPYLEKPDTFHWQSLIRPAYFVPETKKIDDLLEEFRTNKIHMAIVVDEFGGTSGLVTMEDILEEIVGEISDEYDEDEKQYIHLADGSYIFEAKILLTDFFRVTHTNPSEFARLTEEVETLAGLLLEIKGDFPRRQEQIEYGDYRFRVLEVDNRRILKVKFNKVSPQPAVQ